MRCRARGRVQGVGFRYYCVRAAAARGIKGWVKNEKDGSVELLIQGEKKGLEQFLADILRKDQAFDVENFDTLEAGRDPGLKDFTIRFY